MTLVLASGSPRRRELLESLGVRFSVRPVDVDESPRRQEAGEVYVRRLALEKAQATGTAGELVLAADTTVLLDGEILGKPRHREDARSMLERLSGRRHAVLTGIALRQVKPLREVSEVVRSEVEIHPLSAEEIDWYVATDEPMDKAGSYAIQGLGALFVGRVEGNPSNVVGLPIAAVYRLFLQLGHDLRGFRRDPPHPPSNRLPA